MLADANVSISQGALKNGRILHKSSSSEGAADEDSHYGSDVGVSVLMEGFLHKKKQKGLRLGLMNWQHRFCVLDNVEKVIRYGPYENSYEGARSVPFCDIKRAYLLDETPSDAVDEKGIALTGGLEFCVELKDSAGKGNAARVFTFRAQDPVNARDWTRAIHSISLQGQGEKRVSKVVLQKLASFRSASSTMQYSKNDKNHCGDEEEECKDADESNNEFVTQSWEGKAAEAMAAAAARENKMKEEADQSREKLKNLTARIISRAQDRRKRTDSEGRGESRSPRNAPGSPRGSPRGSSSTQMTPRCRFETEPLEEEDAQAKSNANNLRSRGSSFVHSAKTRCLPSLKNTCLPCYFFLFARGGPEMDVDLDTVTGDPEQDFGNLAPGTY